MAAVATYSSYQVKDMATLKELYSYICKEEGLKPVRLLFGKVGKGGAVCTYSVRKQPLNIKIDLNGIQCGSSYALIHEVAHQVELCLNGNATHNRAFKKTFEGLRKKYENCLIARKLYW